MLDSYNNIIDLENYVTDEEAVSVHPHINSVDNKLNNITNNKEEDKDKTPNREKKNTKTLIREYISTVDGQFTINDVMQECNLFSDRRNAVKCALSDFIKDGLIERQGTRSGTYSPILSTGLSMNDLIRQATTDPIEFKLPLAIDAILNTYNRNLIVIQGLSNAGKTAFLMEIARLNRNVFNRI